MSGYPEQTGAIVPVNTAPERPSQARHPQVYQIDFTAVASGKRIASTKRRVRWRFGFANPEALAQGETGTACRGEEHDITLVWSITSGKRLVLADGQEVHYSSSRGGKLDFSWTMRGNHVLKLVAHASPPLSATPGFRQYDFFVDGQSFFSFPKVFRLGLAPGDPRGNGPQRGSVGGYNNYSVSPSDGIRNASTRSNGLASLEAPHNPDEEEAYLQEAIKNSLSEAGPPVGVPGSNPNVSKEGHMLLLDFFDDAASLPSQSTAPLALTGPAPEPYGAQAAYGAQPSSQTYGAPQPASQTYGAAPGYPHAPVYGAPAPLALTGPSPAPLSAYGAPADPWGAPPATPTYSSAPPNPWGATPASTPAAIDLGSPAAQPTPSTLGFASPQPQTNGFATPAYQAQNQDYAAPSQSDYGVNQNFAAPPTPQPEYGAPQNFAAPSQYDYGAPQGFAGQGPPGNYNLQDYGAAPAPDFGAAPAPDFGAPSQAPAPVSDTALFSMSSLSGQNEGFSAPNQNTSLADQAYAKYAKMAEFDLVSKKEPAKANPFEAAPIGGTASLADMQKSSQPKKSVMNSPTVMAGPGALVVSGAQQGNNWGQQAGMQQPQAYGQSPVYGQQSSYGQQQQAYGQPPQQQQGPPPLQQSTFGQAFGQPPPVQQNPYGGYGQQQY